MHPVQSGGLDTESIPEVVPYNDKTYKIEIIKKEVPEEMSSYTRSVLKFGEGRQGMAFLTMWALPYLGFSTVLFWGSLNKTLASYVIFATMLVVELGYYMWRCKLSQKETKRLFPHIKVSDSEGVITTMTPKAYIGQINVSTIDYPLPILPLVMNLTGHRHAFHIERFNAALDGAIKAREERAKKA